MNRFVDVASSPAATARDGEAIPLLVGREQWDFRRYRADSLPKLIPATPRP